MAENTSPEDVSPLDDSGINNDHILDLCDYIIKTMHARYIDDPPALRPSVTELKDMSQTLHSVWALVQEIMDLDRRLRMTLEMGGIDPSFFKKFDGIPPDMPDEFFEDEDEDENSDDEDDEVKP